MLILENIFRYQEVSQSVEKLVGLMSPRRPFAETTFGNFVDGQTCL